MRGAPHRLMPRRALVRHAQLRALHALHQGGGPPDAPSHKERPGEHVALVAAVPRRVRSCDTNWAGMDLTPNRAREAGTPAGNQSERARARQGMAAACAANAPAAIPAIASAACCEGSWPIAAAASCISCRIAARRRRAHDRPRCLKRPPRWPAALSLSPRGNAAGPRVLFDGGLRRRGVSRARALHGHAPAVCCCAVLRQNLRDCFLRRKHRR